MPYVTVGKENSADVRLHYEDHGWGKPIVLIHGYPLEGNSWEKQEPELLAADLKAVLVHLAHGEDVTLCGFSMGTGEVTRYLANYGSDGISKVAMLGVVAPFLLKTDDNEKGVPGEVFDGIKATIEKDRYLWFEEFFKNFFNTDELAPERIGDAALKAHFNVAVGMSPHATLVCDENLIADLEFVEIKNGPHNVGWTFPEEVNPALLSFLAK